MPGGRQKKRTDNGASLGFEQKLWLAADKLRGNMDAAEYKHIVLGLIFLKYISDAFQERHDFLKAESARVGSDWFVKDDNQRRDALEDKDAYTMEGVFFVPPEARWAYLQARAKDTKVGVLLDKAMEALERDNPSLKGVLPKNYAREAINKTSLGELIDLIGSISFQPSPSTPLPVGEGDRRSGEGRAALSDGSSPSGRGGGEGRAALGGTPRSLDILGRVYEYFLGQFASAEGKKGGQFYNPALYRPVAGRNAPAVQRQGI